MHMTRPSKYPCSTLRTYGSTLNFELYLQVEAEVDRRGVGVAAAAHRHRGAAVVVAALRSLSEAAKLHSLLSKEAEVVQSASSQSPRNFFLLLLKGHRSGGDGAGIRLLHASSPNLRPPFVSPSFVSNLRRLFALGKLVSDEAAPRETLIPAKRKENCG